jgi:predicted metalloprotease with PDZ domain
MRGVNLNVFDFDYDLVWAALFMNADETIYGRYGSRDAASADQHLSLAGLRYALREALAAHGRARTEKPPAAPPMVRTVDRYPAAKRLKENACIHCHQAYDFHREELRATSQWQRDEVWVYPLPENVGLSLEVDQGNRVQAVAPHSPAARNGVKKGDTLMSVNGIRVASLADVQYALHRAPARGPIAVTWQHDGKTRAAEWLLAEGWRQTDISWRASTRRVGPPPCVHGEDLTAAEKKALGLSAKRLAFRQGNFVTTAARQAGIRQNDIILGVDQKELEMTAQQFGVYIRLNYRVGDRLTFNMLRDGQRLDLPLKLPSPAPY